MSTIHMDDLRQYLLSTLQDLRNRENPMEPARAQPSAGADKKRPVLNRAGQSDGGVRAPSTAHDLADARRREGSWTSGIGLPTPYNNARQVV